MARYGGEFGRNRPGFRGGRDFGGYAGEFERGVRGEYGAYGGAQYEGDWTTGPTGFGGRTGFGYGREFERGPRRGFGAATGRGYTGQGERGLGGRRTTYADVEPDWTGAGFGRNYGFETQSGRYGSRNYGGFRNERTANRMRASELMTDNPECVTPDATIADAAKKMKELNVGIIPVVEDMDNRRLRGVVTDRDLAVRALAEGKDGKIKVSECMTTEVSTVNKNDTVNDVLNVMRTEQVRRVPVTDREGRLVGIIAQADLAVDYAGLDDPDREMDVEETIERISEPGRPQRRGSFMR